MRVSALPVGRFGARAVVRPPRATTDRFGSSMGRVPFAVRFDVGPSGRAMGGLGALVGAECFPDLPPFVCNVVFACGRGERPWRGGYADPWSPWFNVFFGGYQVDAPCSSWARPFGHRRVGDGFVVDPDELVALGRADWDFFTALPYGVPLDVIRARRAEGAPPSPATVEGGAAHAAGRAWTGVSVERVSVVSGYVSGCDGARLVDVHRAWSPLWRSCFGQPTPRPDHPTSFPLVDMRSRLYVSWLRHGDHFRTFVCGGTVARRVAPDAAEALLAAQLGAVVPLMEASRVRAGGRTMRPGAGRWSA